ESKRAAALADAQGRVEALIASGALDTARQALLEAQGTFGTAGSLPALAKRLEDAARAQEVQGLIQSGQVLVEAGRYADAVSTLDHALRLDPDNVEAAAALQAARREAHAEAERQRLASEEARLRREIDGRVSAIAAALNEGDLDRAAAALDEARRVVGERSEFGRLAEQLAGLRARRDRDAAARSLARGASLRAAGKLGEAAQCVREAARLDPTSSEAPALLAQIEAETEAERARLARQELVARHVDGIEGLLASGQLDRVESALRAAAGELGVEPQLDRLRQRLEEGRLAQAQAAAAARLNDAHALRRSGRLAEAIAKAEEAASLDPATEAPRALLTKLRASLREKEDRDRVEHAVADATVRAERMVKAGDFEGATRTIETAAAAVGDHVSLDGARRRVEEARRARIGMEVESQVRNARTLIRATRFAEARELLDRARQADPESQVVSAAAEELRSHEARHEAERRAESSAKASVAEVERLIRSGAADQAASRLETAIRELGERAEFKPLRKQVKKAAAAAAATSAEPPKTKPVAVPAATAAPSPSPQRGRRSLLPVLIGAAVVVLAVVLVSVLRRPATSPTEPGAEPATAVPAAQPAGPATTAPLVVDARPWGEVISVRGEDGASVELPAAKTTPLALSVPPGRYTVTVRQSDSGRELTAQVVVGAGGGQVAVEFAVPTIDQFLRMVGY
ncbi:MAG: hypothetical protein ACOY3Y_13040, partial [Acidobacteriota bacterium]